MFTDISAFKVKLLSAPATSESLTGLHAVFLLLIKNSWLVTYFLASACFAGARVYRHLGFWQSAALPLDETAVRPSYK